jgi:hypothetical protein
MYAFDVFDVHSFSVLTDLPGIQNYFLFLLFTVCFGYSLCLSCSASSWFFQFRCCLPFAFVTCVFNCNLLLKQYFSYFCTFLVCGLMHSSVSV